MVRVGLAVGMCALVAAGCGSSGKPAATLTIHQSAATTAAATAAVYLPSRCRDQVQRPNGLLLRCGDGDSGFGQISWRTWGGPVAWGTGFAFAYHCRPCHVGGVHHVPAEIYARRPRLCGRHVQYTYLVVVATEVDYAAHLTGAYNVGCGASRNSGISPTQPEF
jgi:hypothetical protein